MFLREIPHNLAPLSAEQMAQMEALIGTMTPLQQAWISGYLAASSGAANVAPAAPVAAAQASLTVLYG
ncbi:MAG: sulfite reductase [NADPH] flavoprotein alpha-component, partial [Pseudomonadota bacterium]